MRQYKTLEDLLQDNIKFCIQNQSNYNIIIKDIQQQPFIKLFEILQDSPHIMDHYDGYQKALTENCAFIENSLDAMHGIEHLCEFLLFKTAGILKKVLDNHISTQRPLCNKRQELKPLNLRQKFFENPML
uniref:Uncharacterized protein n=1 Tax=Strigamia maritima TaxID=126957 RepID=T1IVK1_STRMM